MKTLLVATDFSAASQRAATYTADLAHKMEADVVLCHVLNGPIVSEPQAFDSTIQAMPYGRSASGQELQHLANDLICRQQQLNGQKALV